MDVSLIAPPSNLPLRLPASSRLRLPPPRPLCPGHRRSKLRAVTRTLKPELLDTLPPDSHAARRGRQDLDRINRLLGNPAWFAATAPPLARAGERALEIGAGDGRLALTLRAAGLQTDALDRFPAPKSWLRATPAHARWIVADLRSFDGWAAYPVVLGNLILHHLDHRELAALGATLDRHARSLVFSEPLRCPRARVFFALGALIWRAHAVTRHDARVSIDAGFLPEELPRALQLDPGRWTWTVSATLLGACRLVATRRE